LNKRGKIRGHIEARCEAGEASVDGPSVDEREKKEKEFSERMPDHLAVHKLITDVSLDESA